MGLKSDGTVVAAGVGSEAELAKWNLVLAVPPSQCVLLIGGIIAVVGLMIFFVRRRRAARTKGR